MFLSNVTIHYCLQSFLLAIISLQSRPWSFIRVFFLLWPQQTVPTESGALVCLCDWRFKVISTAEISSLCTHVRNQLPLAMMGLLQWSGVVIRGELPGSCCSQLLCDFVNTPCLLQGACSLGLCSLEWHC